MNKPKATNYTQQSIAEYISQRGSYTETYYMCANVTGNNASVESIRSTSAVDGLVRTSCR